MARVASAVLIMLAGTLAALLLFQRSYSLLRNPTSGMPYGQLEVISFSPKPEDSSPFEGVPGFIVSVRNPGPGAYPGASDPRSWAFSLDFLGAGSVGYGGDCASAGGVLLGSSGSPGDLGDGDGDFEPGEVWSILVLFWDHPSRVGRCPSVPLRGEIMITVYGPAGIMGSSSYSG